MEIKWHKKNFALVNENIFVCSRYTVQKVT